MCGVVCDNDSDLCVLSIYMLVRKMSQFIIWQTFAHIRKDLAAVHQQQRQEKQIIYKKSTSHYPLGIQHSLRKYVFIRRGRGILILSLKLVKSQSLIICVCVCVGGGGGSIIV